MNITIIAKKTGKILPLVFVDYLNGMSKCAILSITLNIFLTTQIELKKLKSIQWISIMHEGRKMDSAKP